MIVYYLGGSIIGSILGGIYGVLGAYDRVYDPPLEGRELMKWSTVFPILAISDTKF